MSWERAKYEAICMDCGKRGYCIKASDDWHRSSTTWVGFENVSPSSYAVARKKVGAKDNSAQCSCGSHNIEIGKNLGACDCEGNLNLA